MRLALIVLTLLAATTSDATTVASRSLSGDWELAARDMEVAIRPGDDFFVFANGTWLRRQAIEPDQYGAGRIYDMVREAEAAVKSIVADAAKDAASGPDNKITDYYTAWMDEAGIEARGTASLRPYLAKIDSVRSRQDLAELMLQPGYASPVSVEIAPDQDDPSRHCVMIRQGQLGLPVREYYLIRNKRYDGIRKSYLAYMTRVQTLAGLPNAAARAKRIMALETRLAAGQWPEASRRDPHATHNPITLAALSRLAPAFLWQTSLASIGLNRVHEVDVAETTAVATSSRAIAEVPVETWKEYLAYRFVSDHASFLPRSIDRAAFTFYSHTLGDVPEQKLRATRGIELINEELGDAIGRDYVKRYWSEDAARRSAEIVSDIRASYQEKIERSTWMDDPTRSAALAKLAQLEVRIGQPRAWEDYATFDVDRRDALHNEIAAEEFEWRLATARYHLPVDRSRWAPTPQTVNGHYEAALNQITLPAALLQPPMLDAGADPAVNYAEAGTMIGHEIGHGFDDRGRHYDGKGRLREWWSKASERNFKQRAARLVTQFDAYRPLPGIHINGRLTLGENLADLGGLEVAFTAYERYVTRHGQPRVIHGYTGEQRFFIAYAQAWQGKTREGTLREALQSQPHSPEKYRVNGIIRNFDPWYAAFNVKKDSALYLEPRERVHLWR